MDIEKFCADFEAKFSKSKRNHPTQMYSWRLKVKAKGFYFQQYFFDPLRDVAGMISVKKQRLLHLAYAYLDPCEAYLEIGSWQGKSLLSAMRGNPPRPTFACDNFAEWQHSKGQALHPRDALMKNLQRYGLTDHVIFYDRPFQDIFTRETLPVPVGVYFYDAAHDEESQYLGVKLAEPFLADEALVIVDDWRFAPDSQSYAKAGTERAIRESKHQWELLWELPARCNGDRAMWWNGMAVFAFRRAKATDNRPVFKTTVRCKKDS